MLLIDLDMIALDIASTYLNVTASAKHLVKAEPTRQVGGQPQTYKQDAESKQNKKTCKFMKWEGKNLKLMLSDFQKLKNNS